jgi:hypothetical protein
MANNYNKDTYELNNFIIKFFFLADYNIDAAQIQNNLGFRIWYLNLGFST